VKGGVTRLDGEPQACARARKLDPKDEEIAATERPKSVSVASGLRGSEIMLRPLLPRRAFRRSVSPQGGEINQKPNSRGGAGTKRRGCLKLWIGNLRQNAETHSASYAGLTRVSIHLRVNIFRRGWIAGSSPAMTTQIVSRARCGILHAASQNRDPGFRMFITGAPALQRTASRSATRALCPGNENYPALTAFLRYARCTAQLQPGGCEATSLAGSGTGAVGASVGILSSAGM
jgi:hypothetical protein